MVYKRFLNILPSYLLHSDIRSDLTWCQARARLNSMRHCATVTLPFLLLLNLVGPMQGHELGTELCATRS
jgi:hypothetical protein